MEGQGIVVTVGEETTTQFTAKATDLAPLTSACSAPISYTQTDGPTGPEEEELPVPPTVVVPPPPSAPIPGPAAACSLGTVRRPKPRRGKRPPLIVKASTPPAGARPSSGRVSLTLGAKPR